MRLTYFSLAIALTASACGGATGQDDWLSDPTQPLPALLSEVGLFEDPADRSRITDRAVGYAPAHPLWTNGSDKERYVVLPPGGQIDNAVLGEWDTSPGTVFFKTFAYEGVPVETRLLFRTESGWDYADYLWDEAGVDAELLDITIPTPVEVTLDGETFVHQVPSRRECRSCHELATSQMLGFDELGLNGPLDRAAGEPSRLEELADLGFFTSPVPDAPDAIDRSLDEPTQAVLAILEGNCTHCHNGGFQSGNAFDMRHPAALGNLVGVMTMSSGVDPGIRIAPGDPDGSVLFRAFSGASPLMMPPLGVQRRDAVAVETLRQWILGLE